jgi:hypothetical protein
VIFGLFFTYKVAQWSRHDVAAVSRRCLLDSDGAAVIRTPTKSPSNHLCVLVMFWHLLQYSLSVHPALHWPWQQHWIWQWGQWIVCQSAAIEPTLVMSN